MAFENNPEEAIDCFVNALGNDDNYWVAAWLCAEAYYQAGNWGAARGYYLKALRSEFIKEHPDAHFSLAWCFGKLKDNVQEEKYYRSCLEVDPNYPFARNNLGWALMKQGKYEEALRVFEDCIQRKQDGSYPLRNRARALAKLGRFSEAIEAWEKSSPRGKLSKVAEERIVALRKLIEKQGHGEVLSPNDSIDIDDVIDGEEPDPEVMDQGREEKLLDKTPSRMLRTKPPVPKEQSLEELVESLILNETEIFNRKLRIFSSPEGLYGRQYAIPGLGRIDLLAEDRATGDLVVIELKRDESHDQVVGQICLYLSWVRENLARDGQRVIGIICTFKASERLRLAAKNIKELELFEYDLTFKKA